jgi:DcuC family C4-dicarboxylate transporter
MVAVGFVVVVLLAVYALMRRVDVRLVLTVAALALGILAGQPQTVVRTFLTTFSQEEFVVPICCAMGFAHVLKHTGCDQHLVHLLVKPVQSVRLFLIPGTVLIGFFVNIPVISQAGTAVTIGPVLIPLLRAARLSPVTVGAALLLGTSLGGDLLNPGAPELQTVSRSLSVSANDCVAATAPLQFANLAVATSVFWLVCLRAERRCDGDDKPLNDNEDKTDLGPTEGGVFRINPLKALVPLVPLGLLFLSGPPFKLIEIDPAWLVETRPLPTAASTVGLLSSPDAQGPLLAASAQAANQAVIANDRRFDTRRIGAAMLIGVVLALLFGGRAKFGGGAKAFFEGAGYSFTTVIGVIVCATCFGSAVRAVGGADHLADLLTWMPSLLIPCAVVIPLLFAMLCGSGMAATQSLFDFFKGPALAANLDPVGVGGLIAVCASAGRTISPVAPVVLLCASMSGSEPFAMIRRVFWPLVAGVAAAVVVRMMLML